MGKSELRADLVWSVADRADREGLGHGLGRALVARHVAAEVRRDLRVRAKEWKDARRMLLHRLR